MSSGPFFTQLDLTAFRNYRQTRLSDLTAGFVLLVGPNGAGKTNVLEAISLFVPGKGLRNAALADLQCRDADKPWALAARLTTPDSIVALGTGYDPVKDKRIVRIDGQSAAKQADLGQYLACLWLTPQMDKIFLEGTAARRKLLDRLIFSLDPGHLTRLNRFERLMGERSRLLKDQRGRTEGAWLTVLEQQMAETAIAIIAARQDGITRLNAAAKAQDLSPFPPLYLQLMGDLETWLLQDRAITVETKLASELAAARGHDSKAGGASYGPHRSDLQVFDAGRQIEAQLCSTGEQKALLISLILAQARLVRGETGLPPVLLLDEIATHLDAKRRAALFRYLSALQGQIWLTGTDREAYAEILDSAHIFTVSDGGIDRHDCPR